MWTAKTEFVGFKVFTALIIKNTTFWDVIPWNLDNKPLHLRRQYSSNTELFLSLKWDKKGMWYHTQFLSLGTVALCGNKTCKCQCIKPYTGCLGMKYWWIYITLYIKLLSPRNYHTGGLKDFVLSTKLNYSKTNQKEIECIKQCPI